MWVRVHLSLASAGQSGVNMGFVQLLLVALGAGFLAFLTHGTDPKYTGWLPADEAGISRMQAYLNDIAKAAAKAGVPQSMLARLLWQESRYRPDIISGETVSSAGAVGIAQIVPRWHPDVDPRDPVASIAYAAQYLGRLNKRFGDWEKALAAYNWGQGNLDNAIQQAGQNWKGRLPRETSDYIAQILGDLQGGAA